MFLSGRLAAASHLGLIGSLSLVAVDVVVVSVTSLDVQGLTFSPVHATTSTFPILELYMGHEHGLWATWLLTRWLALHLTYRRGRRRLNAPLMVPVLQGAGNRT